MKALSIRQPWAWAILHAGKDIENRDWRYPPKFRGEFYIHAASGMTKDEYEDFIDTAHEISRLHPFASGLTLPSMEALPRGGIVGKAQLVDVVTQSKSPWFFGPLGFVLKDVQSLPFRPCKGALGFFDVPEQLSLV
jgi:ASCH domain